MLPQIPVIRLAASQKNPLPTYADGVGTSMVLRSNMSDNVKIAPGHSEIFSTGIIAALPIGMEAQIRSLKESTQTGIIVLNAPLTIDASDRMEIKVRLYNASQTSVIIKKDDPIALMVFSLALRIQWQDLNKKMIHISNEDFSTTSFETSSEEETEQTKQNPVFYEEGKQAVTEIETQTNTVSEETFEMVNNKETIEVESTENQITNTSAIIDNSLINETISSPAILEEFEKIEAERTNEELKEEKLD